MSSQQVRARCSAAAYGRSSASLPRLLRTPACGRRTARAAPPAASGKAGRDMAGRRRWFLAVAAGQKAQGSFFCTPTTRCAQQLISHAPPFCITIPNHRRRQDLPSERPEGAPNSRQQLAARISRRAKRPTNRQPPHTLHTHPQSHQQSHQPTARQLPQTHSTVNRPTANRPTANRPTARSPSTTSAPWRPTASSLTRAVTAGRPSPSSWAWGRSSRAGTRGSRR
jgi:hypothetical protein